MRIISQAHVRENKGGYIEITMLLKVRQAYRRPNKKNDISRDEWTISLNNRIKSRREREE